MNRAFSLVELLVVLALTASLIAMLFPVFAQVREKGRATTCVSNLRQLGSAMAMYAQDYDDLYPRGTDERSRKSFSMPGNPYKDPVYKELPLLTDVLRPYVKDRAIWQCPSDTGFNGPNDTPTGHIVIAAHPTAFDALGSSYQYNAALALRSKLFATGGYRDGKEVGCGEIMVLSDQDGVWHEQGKDLEDGVWNYLMGDGHVRRMTYEQTVDASMISLTK